MPNSVARPTKLGVGPRFFERVAVAVPGFLCKWYQSDDSSADYGGDDDEHRVCRLAVALSHFWTYIDMIGVREPTATVTAGMNWRLLHLPVVASIATACAAESPWASWRPSSVEG